MSRWQSRRLGRPHRKQRDLYPTDKVKVGSYARLTTIGLGRNRTDHGNGALTPTTHAVFVISISKKRGEAVVGEYGREKRVPLASLAPFSGAAGVLPGYDLGIKVRRRRYY